MCPDIKMSFGGGASIIGVTEVNLLGRDLCGRKAKSFPFAIRQVLDLKTIRWLTKASPLLSWFTVSLTFQNSLFK